MKSTIYRFPGQEEEYYGGAETTTNTSETTDSSNLVPAENTWVSDDGGTTYISDPVQGVPYDFCITITNKGEVNSGSFIVKFQLSGDQDPALEIETEIFENLASGESVLAVAHYGAFENKFGVYHVQATVYTADGAQAISADQGFDFTINTE